MGYGSVTRDLTERGTNVCSLEIQGPCGNGASVARRNQHECHPCRLEVSVLPQALPNVDSFGHHDSQIYQLPWQLQVTWCSLPWKAP